MFRRKVPRPESRFEPSDGNEEKTPPSNDFPETKTEGSGEVPEEEPDISEKIGEIVGICIVAAVFGLLGRVVIRLFV